jgi:hypothetical protein
MVVIGEIKNTEIAYRNIGDVIFTNSNTNIAFKHVISFNESDFEIEIETYLPSNELQRGWVGDMQYEAERGMNIETCDNVYHTYKKTIKDVLLARVNSRNDGSDCVIFTYTFLKY